MTSRLATTAAVFSAILLAGMLAARPAMAGYGAVAYDEDARKVGAAWNEGTQKSANESALRACGSPGCSVRFVVPPAMCGAFATPDKGSAWGGAVRKTVDDAKGAAQQNCQKQAKGSCSVRQSECNK